MALVLEALRPEEAHAFWQVFVRGRTDLPHVTPAMHLDRYLAMPPEEQRTYFAAKLDDRIIACMRLTPGSIQSFSIDSADRDRAREVLLKAIDFVVGDADAVTTTYEDIYRDVFEPLGFRTQFERMRMEAATASSTPESPLPLRHPEVSDVEDLPQFLMDAYDQHMEQQFGMHVGPIEEWRGYTTAIFKGETGTFLPLASWVARNGRIAGAILATHWMGMPLVGELGVRRDFRGRGLGRALVRASSHALKELGYDRLSLYVTIGNDAAIRLYESMGFRQVGGRSVHAKLELQPPTVIGPEFPRDTLK